MNFKKLPIFNIDWVIFLSVIPLLLIGLMTMSSFNGQNYFLERQTIWLAIGLIVFFVFSLVDWRFLRRSEIIISLYGFGLFLLSLLFFVAQIKGSKSWLSFGSIGFEPSSLMEIILIILLAKYFSRRHIEIANIKHIISAKLWISADFFSDLVRDDYCLRCF